MFKGKWVGAPRESSYYTNWSCSSIPESKNCFKQGREDRDFLNWKWKPDECELQSFNPKTFLHIVQGKKWAFIGDSVARNHMDSFVCLLSQVSYSYHCLHSVLALLTLNPLNLHSIVSFHRIRNSLLVLGGNLILVTELCGEKLEREREEKKVTA